MTEVKQIIDDLKEHGFSRDQVARCISVEKTRMHRAYKGETELGGQELAKLKRCYWMLKEASE